MKAIRLTAFRHPLDVCEIAVPAALGAGDVLVAVEAAGVCFKDTLIVDGFHPRVRVPLVLGHEAAGRIEAVGEGVSGFRVGDRVCSLGYAPCATCPTCQSGSEHLCRKREWLGEDVDGAYAQFMRARASALVPIPDGVSAPAAAAATCAISTAVHGLKRVGRLQPNETVLVTGAAGAVGAHAILVAKAMGARVIAAAAAGRLGQVRGADEVVASGDQLASDVRNLTGAEGVDLVLEVVGAPTFEQSLRALRWGGRMVVVGNVSPATPIHLALGSLILRETAILGSMNSTRADLVDALRLIADGIVTPVTPTVLPLEDAEQAHTLMRQRRSVGKIVLSPP